MMQAQLPEGFHITKRPIAPGMETLLQQEIPVLDHGFIRAVDYIGNDEAIVQAARVSYGTGTEKKTSTRGLIRYLLNNWHTTPFEMCELKLHVKLPVFVARQWIRHRMANVNEYSARYSILDNEFYFPDIENVQLQSTTNNQGRGDTLNAEDAQYFVDQLKEDCAVAYGAYTHYHTPRHNKDSDADGLGIARELARISLPPNIYTQWYWKVDLHNLLHFLRLRADPHAQWEIRQYANAMVEMVEKWVPLAAEAFNDYRVEAVTFSKYEMEALRDMMLNPDEKPDLSMLGDREKTAFWAKIDGAG